MLERVGYVVISALVFIGASVLVSLVILALLAR